MQLGNFRIVTIFLSIYFYIFTIFFLFQKFLLYLIYNFIKNFNYFNDFFIVNINIAIGKTAF